MPISEEKFRGLETQNANIRERLAKIEGALEANSKNEQKPKSHQLILPAVFTVIFGALIGLYNLSYTQGTKITAILTVLQPQTALKNIATTFSMEPQQAKKELAQVTTSFRQLSQAKVNLPVKTVDETTEALSEISTAHQDLPETWSAIGAFITYRSQMIRGWEETNLPLCDRQFHRASASTEKGSNVITHGPVEVHDCKIVLDSLAASKNLSIDLSIADMVFTHCAVLYNGGPIVLVPVKIARDTPAQLIGHLTFQDCLFIVSLPEVPPPNGIELARALLSNPNGPLELTLKG
jgi:hypothetical protein